MFTKLFLWDQNETTFLSPHASSEGLCFWFSSMAGRQKSCVTPVQGCQVWVCLFHAHALLSSRLEVKDSRTVEQPISLSYHLDKVLSK